LIGVFGRDEVDAVVRRVLGGITEQRMVFRPAPVRALPDRDRLRITPRHFSYLKISEGCDRLCTFCAIPLMRGKHASKPIEDIVAEAQQLVADGVRELIIVAQDTTYYGVDLYGEPRLAELLRELDQIDGLAWIRLMYFYPMYVTDDLLGVIADSSRILPYIDMPLQHISDPVLRRMARRVTRAQTESILRRLRGALREVTLRTTFITGFPGETDDDFEELADFVQQQAFDHVGVFTYSVEEGTPAIKLPDHVPENIGAERRDRLMELQQPIVFARNSALIGRQLDVILDRGVDSAKNVWCGRTRADAPDVDGLVFVTGGECPLSAGDIISCEIVATQGYDLVGVAVDSPIGTGLHAT
jgi:ribosomal protein S12 methylthiotransferase